MVRKSTSRGAQIVHQRKHLGLGLAEADHDAGLGEDAGLSSLARSSRRKE